MPLAETGLSAGRSGRCGRVSSNARAEPLARLAHHTLAAISAASRGNPKPLRRCREGNAVAADLDRRLRQHPTLTYYGNDRVQRVVDSSGSGRYIDAVWGPDGHISTVRDHVPGYG